MHTISKYDSLIRRFSNFIRYTLFIVIGTYVAMNLVLNVPYIQRQISTYISGELSCTLHTHVSIGHIDIGLPGRVILSDVKIDDREGQPLFRSARTSARFSLTSLLRGQITVHNIQLYRFDLHLSRADSLAVPNYQFIVDALSSQDSTPSELPDLRINSLLMRHGQVTYHREDAAETPQRFNPNHIQLKDLRANISLKALQNDSLHTTIRHLSFREQSGFALHELAFKLVANDQQLTLSRFALRLPSSEIIIDTLKAGYDGHADDVWPTLYIDGGIKPSYFTPQDIAAFVPALSAFSDRLCFRARLRGNNREITLSPFRLHTDNNDIQLLVHSRIRNPWQSDRRFFDCRLSQAEVSSTGLRFLARNLGFDISPALARMGYLSFQGSARGLAQNLLTQGLFKCGLGSITTSLTWGINDTQTSFQGHVSTEQFELGTLLGDPTIGNLSLQLTLDGKDVARPLTNTHLQGVLSAFEYKNHTFRDLQFQAHSLNGGCKGSLYLDDPYGRLSINGQINTQRRLPEYQLHIALDNFRPHDLQLTEQHKDTEFAVKISTNIKGNNLDNVVGLVRVDSLQMKGPDRHYFMKNFTLSSYPVDQKRQLSIHSDFMEGQAEGAFHFATLPRSLQRLLHGYLPSLTPYLTSRPAPKRGTDNQLQFDLKVNHTDLLTEVCCIPFELHMPATLKGSFQEAEGRIHLEGYLPNFTYKGKHYESGMLLLHNPDKALQASARISKLTDNEGNYTNASLQVRAHDDRLLTTVYWGNNAAVTYSGTFAATTQFLQSNLGEDKPLAAHIHIHPSDVIINDTTWHIHPSSVVLDSGRVHVNQFNFRHKQQYLRVNGCLSDQAEDSLQIDLNQIKLEYIFDILRFHPVDFQGLASGKAVVRQTLKSPSLLARMQIDNFTFNRGLMGNMDITGRWDEEEGNIYLDADIREPQRSRTQVHGWVSPKQDALDLHITTDSTNLAFLNAYTADIFKRVDGRVSGPVHLFGPFDKLNITGDVAGEAFVEVGILHTGYKLQLDSVRLRPNQMQFAKATFQDKHRHTGTIQGSLRHDHLGDWSYDFMFSPHDMLLYDDPDNAEASIYGSLYGNGTIRLNGGGDQLNVNANLRTSPHTLFVYNLGKPEDITSNAFITFVDKTPRPSWQKDVPTLTPPAENTAAPESTTDVHINAQLEVTPDANIKVIMDPVSGDYATAQGSANFQASYFNKGDFKLYGTYTLDHGQYKLSLHDVIRKDFQLQQGGTISFSGKPEDGNMDLQAVYTVNSASLNDLSPSGNFTQNSVRVNCLLNLTGRLDSPTVDFDLELPNVSEEDESLVRSFISTDEQMEMQIIYLLGIGRFYTYDYATAGTQDNTGQSSAMNSLLSSTLSGQLNNMLSNVINSNNWNFGTNLSTGTRGWTDMEVEGMLSGRLLNNRLLINGNFGYRENQLANTNFIGDFDVQWLLTPSGDIRLKGYNQTNDRYFTKTTLTTQGIGILFKRDFDTWRELFTRRIKAVQERTPNVSRSAARSASEKSKEDKKKRKRWFWEFE